MAALIASGAISWLILAVTAAEIVCLVIVRRFLHAGPVLPEILPNLLAGDFLLLAWGLSASHWLWAAAALLGALAAHGFDMARRFFPPWQTPASHAMPTHAEAGACSTAGDRRRGSAEIEPIALSSTS